MTDITTQTHSFRLRLGDFNAFFTVWKERNFYLQAQTKRLGVYTALLTVLFLWKAHDQLLSQSLFWDELGISFLLQGIICLISAFMLALILVFAVGPMIFYCCHAAQFIIAPVSRYSQSLTVSTDGVIKTVSEESHTTAWTEINDIVETRRAVLIFTGKNTALILPRSAFVSDEEATGFIDTLHMFQASALRR